MKQIKLPGSTETGEAEARAGGGGRFTADEWGALAEVAAWWRNRLAVGDSAAPQESHFGGVDARGAARTVGLTPAAVAFARPLLPGRGAALLALALGVPDAPAVGEVYSLVGLCHFYDAPGVGWLTRYATLGRAPSGTTSTEIRAALDLNSGAPAIHLVGVAGLTIDWTVEAYRLESDE
jgi:hypothetical protein